MMNARKHPLTPNPYGMYKKVKKSTVFTDKPEKLIKNRKFLLKFSKNFRDSELFLVAIGNLTENISGRCNQAKSISYLLPWENRMPSVS